MEKAFFKNAYSVFHTAFPLRFTDFGWQYHGVVMISPCSIILIQIRIDPVFIGGNCLFTIITNNNRRHAAKIGKSVVIDLNPLRFTGRYHPFCIDVLRIGQNSYKYNNGRNLASKFIDQLKGFTCKINFHLLTDYSLDMQGFTVLSAPATIQFTELSILVWLCRFCYTVFLVAAPQVNERHVLPLIHLFKDSWEIGLFITVIPSVGTWLMAVYQLIDCIIRDPFRKRIRQLLTPFKSADEVVDSGFACTEFFSQFLVAQAQCVPFDNDALVI